MREEKAYTLREMTADDVFPMFKIISGIGDPILTALGVMKLNG